MTITTHLILISGQLIPNLTPILDNKLRPDKVVMLVSDDMRARADAMAEILKPRGIKVDRQQVLDPFNIAAISDQVLDILAAYTPGEIALNATGGTKPMAIAAYDAFRQFNHPVFYVQDQLIWLHPKKAPQTLSHNLQIKDYLYAYGADKIEIPNPHGVLPAIRSLTENIITNIDRYANELGTLNYLALQADNPKLSTEIHDKPQSKPMLWELLEQFENAGLCSITGNMLRFPDENARFITNGGWLELHTYGVCLNLKKNLGLQDVASNITIKRQPAGKDTITNEIDVALIKANRLHLIECKTQRFKQDKDADVLYKLDSLRELMGGLQGRAMLVSFNPLDKASRARAKELKIELCSKTELRHLQQYIHNWLI